MPTSSQENVPKKGRLVRYLIPAFVGILLGLCGYIFYLSKAHSYLSDDPKACVNCHIMEPEYATWSHSSHGRNTVCNDCHVPHDNVFRAPIESERLLSDGLIYALEAEKNLDVLKEKLHIAAEFVMPDISTKAKAQKEIGLDIPKEEAAKKEFLKTIVPKWLEEARKEGRLVTQK